MHVAVNVLLVIAGVLIAGWTLLSAVRATILPRAAQNSLAQVTTLAVQVGFRLLAGRSSRYDRRDRVLAMLGPVALLALLTSWLVLIMIAFTLIYAAVTSESIVRCVELSGSSVFTLGTAVPKGLGANVVTYTEAGLGLLLVTLLITYLPSIYGAFSRREAGVSLLRVRAGDPPQATTMLIRYHRIDESKTRLTELWRSWEEWFVDLEESHTSFPILSFFRSPLPEQSWITAAGALLDGASMWVAAVDHPADAEAQLCIRAGFQALQRVAKSMDAPFNTDPQPDDPISVSRQEWDAAIDDLVAAGVPVLADRDQMWQAWKGWRVNYDTALLNLARVIDAPSVPWASDRSPLLADQRWTLRSAVVNSATPNAVGTRRSRR